VRGSAFLAYGLSIAISTTPVLAQTRSDLGYTTRFDPAFLAQLAKRYGSERNLKRWTAFAAEQKAANFAQRLEAAKGREADVLQSVNVFLNKLVPADSDQQHWGQVDYWATPAESIGSEGGDCEDYAMAKYYMLRELGVPLERLRITYVKARVAHMVLAYYARPDAEPLILDNLDDRVNPASERPDLVPVYSFNDDEFTLARAGLKGKPSQIRAWLSVQERLTAQSAAR
jgi:predicted transglutaminase-like cysteine proteinase